MEHKCEYENCGSIETEKYIYPMLDDEKEVSEYLCWEHADKQGFCPMCGYFVAGSGDENYRGGSVCYECYQQLEYETGGDDYDDDSDFFDDY